MSRTFRKTDPNYGLDFDTNRDKKKWFKPTKKYKKVEKSKRKAKEKQVIKNIKNVELDDISIPRFPKTDTWNWN